MHAANEGDYDTVQNCLKCGVYVDMRDSVSVNSRNKITGFCSTFCFFFPFQRV